MVKGKNIEAAFIVGFVIPVKVLQRCSRLRKLSRLKEF
jgi:hypothetical protein